MRLKLHGDMIKLNLMLHAGNRHQQVRWRFDSGHGENRSDRVLNTSRSASVSMQHSGLVACHLSSNSSHAQKNPCCCCLVRAYKVRKRTLSCIIAPQLNVKYTHATVNGRVSRPGSESVGPRGHDSIRGFFYGILY